MNAMGANANVGGPTMAHLILRPDARKVEALEEFLHGTQFRTGMLAHLTLFEAEAHVKRFMIRHSGLLRISPGDVIIIEQMLGTNR